MPGKVLIVDDDPLICKVIAAVAREATLNPSIANDLQKARELARIDPPDLVVCDIFLPDGPGTSLISYLRKHDDQVEIIMVTAGTRFELVVEAIREGASDFLEKPLSKEQLRGTLHRVLNRRAQRMAQRNDPPAGRGTALLVADDLTSLRVMGNLLSEVGVTSYLAQSINEARQQLSEKLPDVVITDVFFQEGSGVDLLKEIKGKHPELPVIVVTGSNKPEIAIQCLRAGVFDLALKPVDREEFQHAVLMARRFRLALEQQSRMERDLTNFRAGLEHLQQTMEQRVLERTAEAVRAQDEAVRVLRSLPSGVLVVDRDLRITEMNLSAEQVLGVPRQDILLHTLEEFSTLEPFQKVVLQCLRTGHSFTNLEMDLQVNASRRTVGYGICPMLGEVGGSVLIYFQDITAKKRLESYLRQSDRLVSLGMMAAGLTHEINNPLNVAMGYADLLERDASDPEHLRRHVQKIHHALAHAAEISNRLLRMARAPAGDLKAVDLHTSIKNVVGLLERKLQVSSLEMNLELGAQVAEVEGDTVELEQLFLNLLVNACDATPGGGRLSVSSTNHSGLVEVTVHDSGPGIPAAQLPHIFEAFFTTKEAGKGTGLGLSICQNIVERHGGTINCESEPGQGTTFTIRLPLLGQARKRRRAARLRGESAPGTSRELALVSDPLGTSSLCTIWLEQEGFQVRSFNTLADAESALPEDQPLTLLIDLYAGGPDNLDVLRRLHGQHRVEFVVVLGNSLQVNLLRAIEGAPPHTVLAKPFSREDLLNALQAGRPGAGETAGEPPGDSPDESAPD